MALRELIRLQLVATIPALEGRVYERHAVTPDIAKPFAVVAYNEDQPPTPAAQWGGTVTAFQVWVYDERNTFVTVDALMQQVIQALHRTVLQDTTGTYMLEYSVSVGNDVDDQDWQAYANGAQFQAYMLGWLDGKTYEPDPVAALEQWLGRTYPQTQTITITGAPTGGSFQLSYAGAQTAALQWGALQTPTTAPVCSAGGSMGTLAAGTWYVGYLWRTAQGGVTLLSPLQTVVTTPRQQITCNLPALPQGAYMADIYVGTSANSLALAGTTNVGTLVVSDAPYDATQVPPTVATAGIGPYAYLIQQALQALSTVGPNSAWVWGQPGGPYTVQFIGPLAGSDQAAMAVTNNLTGGATPEVVVQVYSHPAQTNPATWNPSDARPAIYWRMAAYVLDAVPGMGDGGLQFTTWYRCDIRAHVLAPSYNARAILARDLADRLGRQGELILSDGSPLLFEQWQVDNQADPFRQGQVLLQAYMAVLNYARPPEVYTSTGPYMVQAQPAGVAPGNPVPPPTSPPAVPAPVASPGQPTQTTPYPVGNPPPPSQVLPAMPLVAPQPPPVPLTHAYISSVQAESP